MARVKITVNYAGVGAVLKGSEVREMVDDVALELSGNFPAVIDGEPVEIDVTSYTTDRAAAAVVVMHPFAAGFQAKYGTFTQAAGAAGLEVSSG